MTGNFIDANDKKEIKAGRKSAKPVNYGGVYGIQAQGLHDQTGIPLAQCQKLLDTYWSRNWSVKVIADQCEVKSVRGQLWLKQPVSGFWYSLRHQKDRFSTLNQSTGAYCFDLWGRPKLTEEQNILSMTRRTIAIAAALSVLALGSPLITACANPLANNSFNNGVDKYEQGDYQGAIDDWTKVIEVNPQEVDAYYNRGVVFYQSDQYEQALADFDRALKLNAQSAQILYARGSVYMEQGNYREARNDFRNALKSAPDMVSAHFKRGVAYQRLGQLDKAIDSLTEAIDRQPQDPLYRIARAEVALELGDVDSAMIDYKRAFLLQDDPTTLLSSSTIAGLALVYAELDDQQQASKMWDMLTERNADYSDAQLAGEQFGWSDSLIGKARLLLDSQAQ